MFKRILPTVVAVSTGIIMLLLTLLPVPGLSPVRTLLLQWAMLLGAFAFILAYFQLLRVHLARVRSAKRDKFTSLLVVVSALIGLGVVLTEGILKKGGGSGTASQWLLTNLLVPGESTLLALTAITLILAGMRILRARRTVGSVIFLLVALLVLLGTMPYLGILGEAAAWIQNVPALAGMRGLLLGVSLGILLTGLRVIFMVTRPHSDE
jgi:hypothetical protein